MVPRRTRGRARHRHHLARGLSWPIRLAHLHRRCARGQRTRGARDNGDGPGRRRTTAHATRCRGGAERTVDAGAVARRTDTRGAERHERRPFPPHRHPPDRQEGPSGPRRWRRPHRGHRRTAGVLRVAHRDEFCQPRRAGAARTAARGGAVAAPLHQPRRRRIRRAAGDARRRGRRRARRRRGVPGLPRCRRRPQRPDDARGVLRAAARSGRQHHDLGVCPRRRRQPGLDADRAPAVPQGLRALADSRSTSASSTASCRPSPRRRRT